MKTFLLIVAGLSMAAPAFSDDSKPLFDKTNLTYSTQDPSAEYSKLGSITMFGKSIRTGASTEVNNVDFTKVPFLGFLGKPMFDILGVSDMDGKVFTGGSLSWGLIADKEGTFKASLAVGATFDISGRKISDTQFGVGVKINWRVN